MLKPSVQWSVLATITWSHASGS